MLCLQVISRNKELRQQFEDIPIFKNIFDKKYFWINTKCQYGFVYYGRSKQIIEFNRNNLALAYKFVYDQSFISFYLNLITISHSDIETMKGVRVISYLVWWCSFFQSCSRLTIFTFGDEAVYVIHDSLVQFCIPNIFQDVIVIYSMHIIHLSLTTLYLYLQVNGHLPFSELNCQEPRWQILVIYLRCRYSICYNLYPFYDSCPKITITWIYRSQGSNDFSEILYLAGSQKMS